MGDPESQYRRPSSPAHYRVGAFSRRPATLYLQSSTHPAPSPPAPGTPPHAGCSGVAARATAYAASLIGFLALSAALRMRAACLPIFFGNSALSAGTFSSARLCRTSTAATPTPNFSAISR